MSTLPDDFMAWMEQYSQLSQAYQSLAAPRLAQIKALEVALANETADLVFQMETLESLIRPHVLAGQQTVKVPFLTAIYQHRDKWDRHILFNIAKEVPAIMQAYKDASFVQFRKTAR